MKISAKTLKATALSILEAAGSDAAEAGIVAEHLVQANLKGHDSHGIGMLVNYVAFVTSGKLRPNMPARLVKDAGAILQFDGQRGYGQRVGREAMAAAIERSRTTGVCLMTIRNTDHLGRIGTYGEQAAAAGMISLHFVNVNHFVPLVAPFNGTEARFGTNPVCIALPGTEQNGPFILDFATSIVAQGKARVAYLAGKRFDDDVLLDANGTPTNDPSVLFEGERTGALRALAEHKGGGLIMAGELLAGMLSGGGTIQPGNPRDGGIVNNMLTVVIDPSKLADTDWMRTEMDEMIAFVRSSSEPDPVDHPILMPGEPERARAADRLEHGVEISDEEWRKVVETAAGLGVDVAL